MSASPFRADLRVFVEQRWVGLADLQGLEREYLDEVLQQPRVSCCSFVGGFFIDVGGVAFSDEDSVDEFWMTWSWFFALDTLLDGADEAQAGPWEESALRLWRLGDVLAMEDRSASGAPTTPRVQVALHPFARSLARQGLEFLALGERLLAQFDARSPPVPAPVRLEFERALRLPRDIVERVAAKSGA
ncbi:hypothetical protein LXT21_34250 [Myxococcus sp. K38C18041901]|uniref:hypothetical protein n=1 Tax=Myxococcus guangdongensis TaxID=2906760 RepID=UPI0020A6E84D|nr:hypothetical protein [Myxococcus guangdongensis]MCP3063850.1 hypothetical protein [Myxococcus guangdongensis]